MLYRVLHPNTSNHHPAKQGVVCLVWLVLSRTSGEVLTWSLMANKVRSRAGGEHALLWCRPDASTCEKAWRLDADDDNCFL